MRFYFNLLSGIYLLLISSCVPFRKMDYLKEVQINNEYELVQSEKNKQIIKTGDRLLIEVFSLNERVNTIFRGGSAQQVDYSNYIVDELGYIYFPFIDSIKVGGLTQAQASKTLQDKLMEYLNQLVVKVRIQNNQISLLGELNNAGVFEFHEEKLELFKALALAGGITDFGKKSKIIVLHREGDKLNVSNIDLTSVKYLKTPNYYVYPDDIIIVNAINHKYRQMSSLNLPTLLALITTTITIVYFMDSRNN